MTSPARRALTNRIADRLTNLLLPPRPHGGRVRLTGYDAIAVAEAATEDYDAAVVAMTASVAEAREAAVAGWTLWVDTADPAKYAIETPGERAMVYEDLDLPQWLRDGIEAALMRKRAREQLCDGGAALVIGPGFFMFRNNRGGYTTLDEETGAEFNVPCC
jgi:hypothetical protein